MDVADELMQIGLIRVPQSGEVAGLLQTNVVPLLVSDCLFYRHLVGLYHSVVGSYFSVAVVTDVACGIVVVAFERASRDIEVSDDGGVAGCRSQLTEVLFDGIFRETVADGKDLYGLAGIACGDNAAQQQQMAMAQTLMQNANKMGEAPQEGSMMNEINKKLAGGMDGI